MALTGYLEIIGEHQQEIESDLDKEGVEGAITFFKLRHAIRIPDETGHMNPEMEPQHGVITLTKYVNETSPKLFRALCTRERLTEVTLKWFEHESGVETEVYRIELEHCRLMGITTESSARGENEEHLMLESLEIYYQTIRWHYGDSDGDQFFDFDTLTSLHD